MNDMIRIVSCIHNTKIGDVRASAQNALEAIQNAAMLGADIIVLPRLSLVGASCGSLLEYRHVQDATEIAIDEIADSTKDINAFIVLSKPSNQKKGGAIPVVLYKGELVLDDAELCIEPLGQDFMCGKTPISILSGSLGDFASRCFTVASEGRKFIIYQSSSPISVGKIDKIRKTAKMISENTGCAIAIVNGNIGETTFPDIYVGFSGMYENGVELSFKRHANVPFSVSTDVDCDILFLKKPIPITDRFYAIWDANDHFLNDKVDLLRKVSKTPFLPENKYHKNRIVKEYFDLQVRGLMGRLQNAEIKKVILGVSGGIDSTLALLVACSAIDRLGLSRMNIITVTMPGFGTSERTYGNTRDLFRSLKTDSREISISDSTRQHLSDIGHDTFTHDITFENAQARERSQILFDISNMENALVVGTGDLSEIALGWSTYAGDQYAGYNVNNSVTKGVAREILRYLSEKEDFVALQDTILDILDTPVSPELLPTKNNIAQETEDVLGPYALHDFFLYYFVVYKMSVTKIYDYACIAFEDDYEDDFIFKTLRLFIQRFIGGQFKRSGAPNGANAGPIIFLNQHYEIPSDMSANALLHELDEYNNTKI